jgi:hypothetical protein
MNRRGYTAFVGRLGARELMLMFAVAAVLLVILVGCQRQVQQDRVRAASSGFGAAVDMDLRGLDLMGRGSTREAEDLFRRAAATDPGLYSRLGARTHLSQAYLKEGRFEDAYREAHAVTVVYLGLYPSYVSGPPAPKDLRYRTEASMIATLAVFVASIEAEALSSMRHESRAATLAALAVASTGDARQLYTLARGITLIDHRRGEEGRTILTELVREHPDSRWGINAAQTLSVRNDDHLPVGGPKGSWLEMKF